MVKQKSDIAHINEKKWYKTLQNLPNGIFTLNQDNQIIFQNQEIENIFKQQEHFNDASVMSE